jgi:prophage maintenance system killer protein
VTRYISLAEYFWRRLLHGCVAAWAALVMFIDLNDGAWEPDPPNVDEAESAMLSVAAGDVNEEWLAAWLRKRVQFD